MGVFVIFRGSFTGGISDKEPDCQCRRHNRHGFNPWVGKIPWRRSCNPLQYSCPENPMKRGAWQATVHRVTKSWTQLKWLSFHAQVIFTDTCTLDFYQLNAMILSLFMMVMVKWLHNFHLWYAAHKVHWTEIITFEISGEKKNKQWSLTK